MASQKHSFRRDKAVSMLVVIGLVFQAVMAAVMLPMPLTGSSVLALQRADAAGLSSAIVICTPDGLKRVTLDANGNPVEEPFSAGGCSVCKALTASAFALPVTDVVAPVICADAGVKFSGAEFSFVSASHGIQNNRGPPLSV